MFPRDKCLREAKVQQKWQSLEYPVSVDSLAKLGQQTSDWIVVMLFYKRIDTFGLSLPNIQQAN